MLRSRLVRFSIFFTFFFVLTSAFDGVIHSAVRKKPAVFFGEQLYLSHVTGRTFAYSQVFHVKSRAEVPNKEDWSCGLHALYNMCLIERKLGVSIIPDEKFIRICRNNVLDPVSYSTSRELLTISKALDLSPTYFLADNNWFIEPRFVKGDCPTTRVPLIVRFGDAYYSAPIWKNINDHLAQPGPQCVHFACNFRFGPEPHTLLMTVVKTGDNYRELYIFDNINEGESRKTQIAMRAYASYICQKTLIP
jgi:hypothetical protein